MADSCRPVSRHGRYNATGPSSMHYAETPSYGNGDIINSEENYMIDDPVMDIPDRPQSSRGKRSRNRGDIPPRPDSRRSGQPQSRGPPPDAEGYGRPASRVGYSPETAYRYSHDEYSRQTSQESPVEDAGTGRYILHNSPDSPAEIYGRSPRQQEINYQESPPHPPHLSGYGDGLSYGADQQMGYSPSQREMYRDSPKHHTGHSQRDYMNVSPIQRDEPQLQAEDLYHQASSYSEPFHESPPFRESPYRNSPVRDHHQITGSPETYSRPPTGQRPKSARPKTGRKKSARHRHKQQEEQPPQQTFDASNFLTADDPYGRPTSSLSRYKPLPAIGANTPRSPPTHNQSCGESAVRETMEKLSMESQHLVLDDQFRNTDRGDDLTSGNIDDSTHGADTDVGYSDKIPNVDVLSNFPQHLSDEIFKNSVENYGKARNQSDNEEEENREMTQWESRNDLMSSSQHVQHYLPTEPSESDARLLLAIKLPGGGRHQRYFRPSDTLESVLRFAESKISANLSEFNLVCNAPKTIFMDLSQQISDTSLKDRTVLYLEEKIE